MPTTRNPTLQPSVQPSVRATESPTKAPTVSPSVTPTETPTAAPTAIPTTAPTKVPTEVPSASPSVTPTEVPTQVPTKEPTAMPTARPSAMPTEAPTASPSVTPTKVPTEVPTETPTAMPTVQPSSMPTEAPSAMPTASPTFAPTEVPTAAPTASPSIILTGSPTKAPTAAPTTQPSAQPSVQPTFQSSEQPSVQPSDQPTLYPAYLNFGTLPSNQSISLIGTNSSFKIILPFLQTKAVLGNGYTDIIIGQPVAGTNYIISGGNSTPGDIDLAELSPNQVISETPAISYDYSGRSASSVGDINGDGYKDYIIGVPFESRCYVLFGSASGFSNLNKGFTIFGTKYSIAGWSVADAGDVNGDGFADIIIGDPQAVSGAGAAYVIFGKIGGFTDIYLDNLDSTQGFAIFGRPYDYLGISVSSAGDVNNDGFADVVVGASRMNSFYSGAAYVVFGKAFSTSVYLTALTIDQGFAMTGSYWSYSGCSVSSAGDYNKDGFADVIIGSTPKQSTYYTQISYLVYGKASGFTDFNLASMSSSQGIFITGGGVFVNNIDNTNNIMIGNNYGSTGSGYVITDPTGILSESSLAPTIMPSIHPTTTPSVHPSLIPSANPTMTPTQPTMVPTPAPSGPTFQPTSTPTAPTISPTLSPTKTLSVTPTQTPTKQPSEQPTKQPTLQLTLQPSEESTKYPRPISQPSEQPSSQPSGRPTSQSSKVPISTFSNKKGTDNQDKLVIGLVGGFSGTTALTLIAGLLYKYNLLPSKVSVVISKGISKVSAIFLRKVLPTSEIQPTAEVGPDVNFDDLESGQRGYRGSGNSEPTQTKTNSWFPWLLDGGKLASIMPLTLRTADQELDNLMRRHTITLTEELENLDDLGSLYDYIPSDDEMPPLEYVEENQGEEFIYLEAGYNSENSLNDEEIYQEEEFIDLEEGYNPENSLAEFSECYN